MTVEITKALVAFQQNVGTIHKTAKSYTNRYAPLSEVLSVVHPALCKQGLTFSHTFEPGTEGSEPILICTLLHTSGETLKSRLPLVIARGKNPTQDLGSAITYCKRYTLMAILGLDADVDTDGAFADEDDKEERSERIKAVVSKLEKKTVKKELKPKPALTQDKGIDKETKDIVNMRLAAAYKEDPGKVLQLAEAFPKKFPEVSQFPKPLQHVTTEAQVAFIDAFLKQPTDE
jgi:hypothetical protein